MRAIVVAGGTLLDALSFPMADDEQALANRREAAGLLRAAEKSAAELGREISSVAFGNLALWLELRDPLTADQARQQLDALLSDGEQAVGYIPLGLSFGVALDREAIERALARRAVLEPDGSVDMALARLALANNQNSASEAADYFTRYRDIIIRHLNVPGALEIEARFLVAAGRVEAAQDRIVDAGEALDGKDRERIQAIIANGADGPTTADLEATFERDASTANLSHLVVHLSEQGYSERFFELARRRVTTTRSRRDAKTLVRFLLSNERHEEVAMILADVPDVVATSFDLRSALAWSTYRQGDLNEASRLVEALRAERDTPIDRALFVNLLISSGRWSELAGFVESEWAARDKRTPEELLGVAQLAAQGGSQRLTKLLEETAGRAQDDANILLGCYMAAMESGWGDEYSVHRWFERAAELSGEDGPIRSASLEELAKQAPDWERGRTRRPSPTALIFSSTTSLFPICAMLVSLRNSVLRG